MSQIVHYVAVVSLVLVLSQIVHCMAVVSLVLVLMSQIVHYLAVAIVFAAVFSYFFLLFIYFMKCLF